MKKLAMAIVMVLICVGVWAADPDKIIYEEYGNGWLVVGYDGVAVGHLEIPTNYDDYPILSIANYAFTNHQLTSLIIPEGVIAIGMYAFKNNQLTNVVFPDSLLDIDEEAFRNNKLTNIELGERTNFVRLGSTRGQPSFDINITVTQR